MEGSDVKKQWKEAVEASAYGKQVSTITGSDAHAGKSKQAEMHADQPPQRNYCRLARGDPDTKRPPVPPTRAPGRARTPLLATSASRRPV